MDGWRVQVAVFRGAEPGGAGEAVSVTYGRSRRPVALLVPPPVRKTKRKLGLLTGKVKIQIARDWSLTDEEFLGR